MRRNNCFLRPVATISDLFGVALHASFDEFGAIPQAARLPLPSSFATVPILTLYFFSGADQDGASKPGGVTLRHRLGTAARWLMSLCVIECLVVSSLPDSYCCCVLSLLRMLSVHLIVLSLGSPALPTPFLRSIPVRSNKIFITRPTIFWKSTQ